ncbi:MAG: recombinase family protein [Actinobacteria bacterium]|nr:recombinase family protein [Actinomycetota bacterium]
MRLSRSTEESTSIERQREIIQQWTSANGHTLVGWAEDIDVSGSVDPFDTPGLGAWLGDRAAEWDVLCAWKLDRLGRDAVRLNKLIAWCQDHDKTMVSCTEGIDISTPVGRLIANVIAFLAEGELEAIRERQVSSRRKLRELARWPGGKPPYGYTAVRNADGAGWHLEVDPLAAAVVRRIMDNLLDGVPLTRIGRELSAEGYRTPGDYYRSVKAGQPELVGSGQTQGRWAVSMLRNMLRNRALRGYAHHNGETVRDDDGQPVQLAEPLVGRTDDRCKEGTHVADCSCVSADDEWELIQAALDRAGGARKDARRSEASPLSGLAVCLICGGMLHHDRYNVRGHHYRYYRCVNRETKTGTRTGDQAIRCQSVQIPADTLESFMEDAFLGDYGDQPMTERVWVPGNTNEAELRAAVAAFDELSATAEVMTSQTAKDRLQRQLAALDEKMAELESAPSREAHWEHRPTGQTHRQAWESTEGDAEARRDLLMRSGITIAASITGVEGKRSASNPGALAAEIRSPVLAPEAEPIPESEPGFAERVDRSTSAR